ncbi:MAG: hypothetical protein ACRD0D_15715, partial [Acidimicrobiales bacterium]
MVSAVARFWRLHRGLTLLWVGAAIVGPLTPLAMAVASGRVVDAAVELTRAGGGARSSGRLVAALVSLATLTVASVVVDSLRWRSADILGHRFRADQRQRVMAAYLGPAGIDHVHDPAIQDAAEAAHNSWLRSLPEGLMNVVGTRVNGFGGAVLVAAYEPAGALALSLAWVAGGRWKWRRATADVQANLGQVPELRRSAATVEVATSPMAAK